MSPQLDGPEVLSYTSDKTKLFAEVFSENSYLGDLGNSAFLCRTNLELPKYDPKMIKKAIASFDSTEVSVVNCILKVVRTLNLNVHACYLIFSIVV